MKFGIISLFPSMFEALKYGITGRALNKGLIELQCWDPRDYTENPSRRVDDRPYGGGPGMVMNAAPLRDACLAARQSLLPQAPIFRVSPQGRPLDQAGLHALKQYPSQIWVAGRYEGMDQRFVNNYVDESWSIGDYIISGGELAIMVAIDGLTRLLPGALGHPASSDQDSFSHGLLDHPHYTRPEIFEHEGVPEVLLRGNHQAIAHWRLQQALKQTQQRRPDLLAQRSLSAEEQALLHNHEDIGE